MLLSCIPEYAFSSFFSFLVCLHLCSTLLLLYVSVCVLQQRIPHVAWVVTPRRVLLRSSRNAPPQLIHAAAPQFFLLAVHHMEDGSGNGPEEQHEDTKKKKALYLRASSVLNARQSPTRAARGGVCSHTTAASHGGSACCPSVCARSAALNRKAPLPLRPLSSRGCSRALADWP